MKINVETPEVTIPMQGERISSELIWSKNVEKRTHIANGTYSTKHVPTDNYRETWLINGEVITVNRYSTNKGDKYMLSQESYALGKS